MATSANIMITSDWKTFAAARCHYDGGLWGVGRTLDAMYNDTDTILDLVALGDMSTLEVNVEATATDERNVHRHSKGEVEMKDATEVFRPTCGVKYIYVWCTVQEKWFVGTCYTSTPNFKPLDNAMKQYHNEVPTETIFGEELSTSCDMAA